MNESFRRELRRVREQISDERVSWRLRDGRKVSYSPVELFEALSTMMRRIYAAIAGEEVGPVPQAALDVLEAADRAQVNEQVSWASDLEWYLESASDPVRIQEAREELGVAL